MLNTDSPRGKETENSNHDLMHKPVSEEESLKMYVLKQLEVIQKCWLYYEL